jgi:cobalt-zinc-cadmium efflux system protein
MVMPGGPPGDAFLTALAEALHDRFEITHPTIQVEIGRLEHGCRAPEFK